MIAALKLLRVLVHAVAGWFTVVFAFPRLGPSAREARVQAWSLEMLRILGVRLRVQGHPAAQGPVLLVANHISWLDIMVLHAARYCRFVSKADIQRWPLVGTMATGAGTLYIQREKRRDALRVVHSMAQSLKAGDVVAVFPEGTTGEGTTLLPFHGNLIQAALAAEAPVQPLGLRYVDAASGQPSFAARYIQQDTLIGSAWRLLSSPPIEAVAVFGEPHGAEGRDRRQWAHDLQAQVEALRRA
ncbi:lysophospholipid acyltransferase family protein [Ramlibacter sp.]|uniref:lysophospholipid acyltransferase family protein n=1 Tax=Ramlibacter sp. TaxID=1917967 RepID=UPI00178E6356|nr:lysophospholipid acyltransferase family protein [Ramlibacter sp.]MBA2674911.1 1-acyl-sn-glycerol-3-phosphate acyltransferase [Ramlibacter sp.]